MPSNPFAQLAALNKSLTLNQKLSILGLTVVILGGLSVFAFLLRQENYQLLFSGLDASNANAVVERLKAMNVPYELEDGGKSVLIPAERLNEVRLELASQNLPTVGRLGYELFDQNNWGITDFAQKVNYRRALEGELERTILSLSEVEQARVHLVLEKESLFEEKDQPAKASVTIKLANTASLSKHRVNGIRNLVAFSVEGLNPQNVTVVDVNGNLLTEGLPDEESLSDAQANSQRKMEREICQKVVSILEPIVGNDKVRVSASVQLDFSETTEKTERVLDPIIISQQTSREYLGTPGKEGGIPFRANDPAAAPSAAAATTTTNGRSVETETTNYEVSKTTRNTVLPSGALQRLSVAVVVDDKSTPGAEGAPPTAEVRSPEEMERLRNLVSATIGLRTDRGDTLTVENISFSPLPQGELAEPETGVLDMVEKYVLPYSRYLLILLLFGLFYMVIFRPVKNRVFSYVEVEKTPAVPAQLKDPALLKQLETALTSELALPAPEANASSPEAIMKRELLKIAKEDPQAVTQLIRSWMSEGAQS